MNLLSRDRRMSFSWRWLSTELVGVGDEQLSLQVYRRVLEILSQKVKVEGHSVTNMLKQHLRAEAFSTHHLI